MFKFTLTIASSVFLLMSGATNLFAMEHLDDLDGKSGKQLVIARTEDAEAGPINHMPQDVTGLILYETSKVVSPRLLITICKPWYSVMREGNDPQGAELHYLTTNLLETSMNPFMKTCMHTYWDNQYYNGSLPYTPTDGSAVVTQKFPGLKNTDGTFDLSTCKSNTTSLDQYLVITESMDRFFKVGEENKDKTVIGIMRCHRVLQAITDSPNHPFFPLIVNLDPDKAPVLLFWRWGNDTNLTLFDYLITASVGEVSSRNLYENWQKRAGVCRTACPPSHRGISCQFFKPK